MWWSSDLMSKPILDFSIFVRRLKLEAVALALLMVVLMLESSAPFWIMPASFLLFDIGMIGYAFNPRIGSITYNALHNLTVPTLCIVGGIISGIEPLSVIGYCWTFHIAVDRALGFGLKHKHSFHDTHLGHIQNKKTNE
jgi:Domain of unknown function (DUF4260)